MPSPRALITGITGQDGSYLAESLLEAGYEVHGIVRRSSSFNTGRIDHLHGDERAPDARVFLHYGDMTDGASLLRIVQEVKPDEIYNLAAQSHVAVSFETPEYTAQADAVGTLRLLEVVRATRPVKFYHASTSELFGSSPPPQNERTGFRPRSPYAAAKLYAHWMCVNYREAYGMFNCCGILFNHESPRRGENFVSRKIVKGLAGVIFDGGPPLVLGNLEAIRDWGHARDYVRAMRLMMAADEPMDLVIASGEGRSVREFADCAASQFGIKLKWEGDQAWWGGELAISTDARHLRPLEVDELVGDSSLAREVLGWKPEISFDSLVMEMVEAEIKARGNTIRRGGQND